MLSAQLLLACSVHTAYMCVMAEIGLSLPEGHACDMQVAKSPAAPMAAFAYNITEAGLEILEGHHVPDQVQSSVINMHVAHEVSYEPQGMDI